MADKGYKSKYNDEILKKQGSKSRIMHKAYSNKPLTRCQKIYNKIISRRRWVVKRWVGSLKRWFGSGVTRLKGIEKVHALHVLEAMAHNTSTSLNNHLKRSPVLVRLTAKN